MNNKRPFENSGIFKTIDTEEKAYWLGFFSADGSVASGEKDYRMELSLAIKDIGHVEKWKAFIGLPNKIALREKTQACRYSFRSKEIKEDLARLGCTPRKSLTLRFPTYSQVPKHLMRHFMRGYMDGDGWISYTGVSRQVGVIGTEEFLVEMLREFNMPHRKLQDVHGGPQRRYMFSSDKSKEFIDLLYSDCTIVLDRKYQAYQNYMNNVPFRQR